MVRPGGQLLTVIVHVPAKFWPVERCRNNEWGEVKHGQGEGETEAPSSSEAATQGHKGAAAATWATDTNATPSIQKWRGCHCNAFTNEDRTKVDDEDARLRLRQRLRLHRLLHLCARGTHERGTRESVATQGAERLLQVSERCAARNGRCKRASRQVAGQSASKSEHGEHGRKQGHSATRTSKHKVT
jgi:hypothetical protein